VAKEYFKKEVAYMTFKKSLPAFIKQLEHFDYDLSSTDHIWRLIFPDKTGKWYQVHIVKYQKSFLFHHIDGNCRSLEVAPNGEVHEAGSFRLSSYETGHGDPEHVWLPILNAARKSMDNTAKDWVLANRQLRKEYPLNRRFGIVPNSIIRETLSDIIRIDKDLGMKNCRKFIRLIENGYFNHSENTTIPSMTSNKYFEYCRIAFIAAKRKEDHVDAMLDGRSMYRRYADGRHEGLLDINGDSEQEFADWIDGIHPKKTSGGHPWEIKRGGNTTHIDLSVFRPYPGDKKSFCIQLRGESINRLEETIRMFLAIHDASLPISIANPEGVRKRLLGQDNIGIIPRYESLHRANQHFRENECVFDVMHYDDLGRAKRRVVPFVNWEPLPVMKLKTM
jgi:hypothetical protein